MPTKTETSLKTPWKNRVAFVHEVGKIVIFLLVHPSGELLLVGQSDKGRPTSSARWDRACILWVEEHQEYWMCKYGVHDKKYSLSGLDKTELTTIAVNFGIEFRPKGESRIPSPLMLDSLAARSLLNWTKKHPKMAKENAAILAYLEIMEKSGALALPDESYTGY